MRHVGSQLNLLNQAFPGQSGVVNKYKNLGNQYKNLVIQ